MTQPSDPIFDLTNPHAFTPDEPQPATAGDDDQSGTCTDCGARVGEKNLIYEDDTAVCANGCQPATAEGERELERRTSDVMGAYNISSEEWDAMPASAQEHLRRAYAISQDECPDCGEKGYGAGDCSFCEDQRTAQPATHAAWTTGGDCGDSEFPAIYDAEGNKLALVFRGHEDQIVTEHNAHAALIAALQPIAAAYPDDPGTSDLYDEQPVSITLGDVRRVWAALRLAQK